MINSFKMFTSIFLLTLFFNCFSAATNIGYDDIVKVQQGLLRGHLLTTSGNTAFRAFQGIPFAEPPVGKLRFQVYSNTLDFLYFFNY